MNFGEKKKKGPSEEQISPVAVLYIVSTIGLRKALRVMWIFVSRGECTLVVRELPAGPEKLSFGSPESTFFKNFVNFGVMQETFPSVGIFVKRIARHNRYIPGQVVT